jgi:hypothetical protein
MAARKAVDPSAFEWRIEPVTIPPEKEDLVREDLRFCAEVRNPGGANDTFEQLRRHNGLIVGGYNIIRGQGAMLERYRYVPWRRLGERQQRAFDNAFNVLKALNGAMPMPEVV